jgi:3-hydroxyisobutyrate dehydrogenase-like beta-hydroxyacid dehydrogenase
VNPGSAYELRMKPGTPAPVWPLAVAWRNNGGVATIGLLHPGEMGAAVGAGLVRAGHTVLWLPAGRSAATARRAADAGLTAAQALDGAEVVLSICPPHAALGNVVRGPLFVDCNAISPATALEVGSRAGEWVDGGIIGPPPRGPGTTRLFLAGARADHVAALFARTDVEAIVLAAPPPAASALKMAYAAWTKGSAALLLALRATARANGVEDALLAEWDRSQPELSARSERAGRDAASKGWRWIGEMEEIAATFAAAGQPAGFHEAAAAVYRQEPSADSLDR